MAAANNEANNSLISIFTMLSSQAILFNCSKVIYSLSDVAQKHSLAAKTSSFKKIIIFECLHCKIRQKHQNYISLFWYVTKYLNIMNSFNPFITMVC